MRRGEKEGRAIDENSTSTPLGAGETYTGDWYITDGCAAVVVSIKASHAGTLNIEFSPDGANNDSSVTYSIAADTNEVHKLTISRKYVRVRYVNGASAQTYFRLQTMLGSYESITAPFNQIIQDDADAIITKSLTEEFLLAAGLVEGKSIVNKFGLNPDIDTATVPEDVWGGGGVYTGFASAAEQLRVSSSDVNDTAAGTGLRSLRITGLDADFNVIAETVTLNGTTPVVTTQSFIRAHTATGVTAGSGGVNVGTITITQNVTTANVMLIMSPQRNQTNNSAYTVPAGYTAYMRFLHCAVRGSTTLAADGLIWTRPFNGVFRSRRPFTVTSSYRLEDNIYGGLVFTEKSDIVVRIESVSANNTPVNAGYDLILVRNSG